MACSSISMLRCSTPKGVQGLAGDAAGLRELLLAQTAAYASKPDVFATPRVLSEV